MESIQLGGMRMCEKHTFSFKYPTTSWKGFHTRMDCTVGVSLGERKHGGMEWGTFQLNWLVVSFGCCTFQNQNFQPKWKELKVFLFSFPEKEKEKSGKKSLFLNKNSFSIFQNFFYFILVFNLFLVLHRHFQQFIYFHLILDRAIV